MGCNIRQLLENRRRLGHHRGNSVIELAIVLTILLSLSFGTVEFGYYFYVKNTLIGAAREGAREAITPTSTNTTVTNAAKAVLTAAGMNSVNFTFTIRNSADTADVDVTTVAEGTAILVKVYGSWGTVGVHALSGPLGGIGSGKLVTGTAIMRKEAT
jgi:Flp pilus assembly protein TadG